MKRLIRIILFIFAGIILLFTYLIIRTNYQIGDNTRHYSSKIEESKQNGLYLGHYYPIQDSLVLGDLSFKAETIWYERNWTISHNLIFHKSIKIDSGIHIIAPYFSLISSDLNAEACFRTHRIDFYSTSFKVNGLGYVETMHVRPDTLWLHFVTDYGYGYKDSIIYVIECIGYC